MNEIKNINIVRGDTLTLELDIKDDENQNIIINDFNFIITTIRDIKNNIVIEKSKDIDQFFRSSLQIRQFKPNERYEFQEIFNKTIIEHTKENYEQVYYIDLEGGEYIFGMDIYLKELPYEFKGTSFRIALYKIE